MEELEEFLISYIYLLHKYSIIQTTLSVLCCGSDVRDKTNKTKQNTHREQLYVIIGHRSMS